MNKMKKIKEQLYEAITGATPLIIFCFLMWDNEFSDVTTIVLSVVFLVMWVFYFGIALENKPRWIK